MRKLIRFQTPNGQRHVIEIAEPFITSVLKSLRAKGYTILQGASR